MEDWIMQNMGTKMLESNRLILRKFCYKDVEPMFENWASDSAVTEFLTWKPHADSGETKSLIDSWIKQYSDTSFYNWVIELKQTQEIVGNISVIKLNEKIEAAEIGYCMGKNWWGQSIMPEALITVIHFLFDKIGMNRIAACHDSNNAKSGRVMIKAGMQYEGTMREASINKHGLYDKVWYSILKSDCEGKSSFTENI